MNFYVIKKRLKIRNSWSRIPYDPKSLIYPKPLSDPEFLSDPEQLCDLELLNDPK